MIKVTDEMKAAFRAAQEARAAELVAEGAPLGAHDILDRGIAAVLAIVERDLVTRPRECGVEGPDGAWCERQPGHGELHGRVTDAGLALW